MTACLRCDGEACNKVVGEADGDLSQWFRVARYGYDFAIEPKSPTQATAPSISVHSHFVNVGGPEAMEAFDVGEEEEYVDDDYASDIVLHFCSSTCMASWATQAAALE